MLDANNNKIRTTGDKGADGSAGVAGTSPVLSVATDTDGKVYWKVNGEWLLNSGKKVQATGDKGDKGEQVQQVLPEQTVHKAMPYLPQTV